MFRRWLVLCAYAGAFWSWELPAVRAEIQVGAAVRVITPEPAPARLGRDGHPQASREKRGELTARAIVFRKGDVSVAVVALDLLGFPSALGDRVRAKVSRIPAEEHPHRLDPHAQRPGLLRVSPTARAATPAT